MGAGVADLPHALYEEAIAKRADDSPAGFATAPAGAYRREADGIVPESRPGCTILAEPYPIRSIADDLGWLQNRLSRQCPEFAAVPIETLHMTIADLISRDAYTGLAPGERDKFCDTAARAVSGRRFPEGAAGTIAGIGVFSSIVITLVSFTSPVYETLVTIREAIHAGFGLSWPYPFTGHVTLGYVEIPADADSARRDEAEQAVASAREALRAGGTSLRFGVVRPAVYTFEDMSRFDAWPR